MDSEISFDEAMKQWEDLVNLGSGRYWKHEDEPRWAMDLTRNYAAAWREVAYERIARAFLTRLNHLNDKG